MENIPSKMKKSELRQMIKEMIQEEMGVSETSLKEEAPKPGYVIKAWDNPELKSTSFPSFDSEKNGIRYESFDEVISVLSSELSDLGAYEITWIQSGK
jgi:hypothetical protein